MLTRNGIPVEIEYALNVTKYGTKGNGIDDDYTSINAALTALAGSGDLYFPKGTYRIASNLTIASGIRPVFEQGAMISVDGIAISAITKANPGIVETATAHNFSTNDKVRFKDVGGMVELNYSTNGQTEYTVTVISPTKFALGIDTSGYTTYTSGGYAQHILTINGTLDAGLYQIFTGLGAVSLPGSSEIHVEWFGGSYNGVTDDASVIQKAINAISSGGIIKFPNKQIAISGLILKPGIFFRGANPYEYQGTPTIGTTLVSVGGGTNISTRASLFTNPDTVLIWGNTGECSSVIMENIKVRNTHYDWALCFDGYSRHLKIDHCRFEGGVNSSGIYFQNGHWQYIHDTEMIYCNRGVYFSPAGVSGATNNSFNIVNCKIHLCNYGIQAAGIGYSYGGAIRGCAFEGNTTWDVYAERPYVEISDCYWDGSHIKVYNASKLVGRGQLYPYWSRDYNTTIQRQLMGEYNLGIPHIDRNPLWQFGNDRLSYLSLHARETLGTPVIISREGEGINITTNNYTLSRNGRVTYVVPQLGDSAIQQTRSLLEMGMSMTADWTIGIAFYNDNTTYPVTDQIMLQDHYDGGAGLYFRINGTQATTPGLVEAILYNAGATVIQTNYRLLQGLNILYLTYQQSSNSGQLNFNGDTAEISNMSTKMAFAVSGIETIFNNLQAYGIYFVEFIASAGYWASNELSMLGTAWRDEQMNRLTSQRINCQNVIRFPKANVESLTATKTLVITASMNQFIDANGMDRDVILPAEEISDGLLYFLANTTSAAFALIVKDDSNATIVTIAQNECGILVCNGSIWKGFIGGIT